MVALVLFDVFETVVVPRRSTSMFRLSPRVALLWPVWRRMGISRQPAWRREDFLGRFAPLVIVLMLVLWVVSLIGGFGLILHGLGDQLRPHVDDYVSAVYAAGTSLLTIGFGDIVAVGAPARVVVLTAAASGLTIVALVISLTFNLYASFARREILVLLLDSRAGVPPSGVMMLETFGEHGMIDELSDTFGRFEVWAADMLDSHLAYPILPFFRSSHDGQSWVSALGAVLDAATLLMTIVPEEKRDSVPGLQKSCGAARLLYGIGCHTLIDLAQVYFSRDRFTGQDQQPGIDRKEYEAACHALSKVGYPVTCSEESWQAFAARRAVYAVRLNLLAHYFASPPTQWIGDRTILTRLHTVHLPT